MVGARFAVAYKLGSQSFYELALVCVRADVCVWVCPCVFSANVARQEAM